MLAQFKKAGFKVLTDKKYINGYSYLLEGDILLYENHHAATNITRGKKATVPATPAAEPERPVEKVEPSAIRRIRITGKAVNVRKAASLLSNRVGIVKKGDILTYTGYQSGKWYQVNYNNRLAYVSSKYAEII